jgi:hypothetical protein
MVRGDESRPETAEMRRRIAAFKAQQVKDSMDGQLRWNWNTPYIISKHNPARCCTSAPTRCSRV